MATRKPKASGSWPKITKGTHLTVTTHEDGTTTLEWDDEKLLQEVREAIAGIDSKPTPKAKKAPAKKTVAKKKTK